MATLRKTRTTTVRLPLALYQQLKSLADNYHAGSSLNDLMVRAIKAYVRMHRRKQIDAAFADMAQDADYQREAQRIAEDFALSDWEALRQKENDLETRHADAHFARPSR